MNGADQNMSLLQNLFGTSSPLPVPAKLPAMTLPSAAAIAQAAEPGAEALKLLTPQLTPPQYLAALQEKQLGDDMIKTLAHGLPDDAGVTWAAKCAEKVADKLPPSDQAAAQAALAWAKDPSDVTQAAAAAAATQADLKGPGAWAAQAAAWSKPATPGLPRLAPPAISAAVLMAAAIQAFPKLAAPKPLIPPLPDMVPPALEVPPPVAEALSAATIPAVPPKVLAKTFASQQPFIAMGLDIASGKTPVG